MVFTPFGYTDLMRYPGAYGHAQYWADEPRMSCDVTVRLRGLSSIIHVGEIVSTRHVALDL